MSELDSTCWTVIREASRGEAAAREIFARRYEPVVRACPESRWHGQAARQEFDDAVQEVFLDCFRPDGALAKADPERPAGFRAFLYGVTRTVALHFGTRRHRGRERQPASESPLDAMASDEEHLSQGFDRAWAETVLNDALDRQIEAARYLGPDAVRRVALLKMRAFDAIPIREIARLWSIDAARLHHDYALARKEFKEALRTSLAFHAPRPEPPKDTDLADLLALLK